MYRDDHCVRLFISLARSCTGFVPVIPTYAWMIIAVVLVKGTGIMSEELEDAAREWGTVCHQELDGGGTLRGSVLP